MALAGYMGCEMHWVQLIVRSCIAAFWLLVMCFLANLLAIFALRASGHSIVLTLKFSALLFGALAGWMPFANEPFGPAKRAFFGGQRFPLTVPRRFVIAGVMALFVIAGGLASQLYERVTGVAVVEYLPVVAFAEFIFIAAISLVTRWRYLKHLT